MRRKLLKNDVSMIFSKELEFLNLNRESHTKCLTYLDISVTKHNGYILLKNERTQFFLVMEISFLDKINVFFKRTCEHLQKIWLVTKRDNQITRFDWLPEMKLTRKSKKKIRASGKFYRFFFLVSWRVLTCISPLTRFASSKTRKSAYYQLTTSAYQG